MYGHVRIREKKKDGRERERGEGKGDRLVWRLKSQRAREVGERDI